jgi:cytochrome c oxidase cbb3-type subunit 3
MAGPTNDDIQDKLLDHTYDGIQEYDNPMPRWWLTTFAGTVIFSVIYLFNVGPVGSGEGRLAEYEADMKAAAAAHPAPSGDISPDQLAAIIADGGGLIGPSLADNAWIHGGQPADVYKVVVNGVLEKGMPNWGKLLKPDQLQAVVAYVVSLQGTNPANPKPPQGTVVQP